MNWEHDEDDTKTKYTSLVYEEVVKVYWQTLNFKTRIVQTYSKKSPWCEDVWAKTKNEGIIKQFYTNLVLNVSHFAND